MEISFLLPILVSLVGIYLLFKLRFFFIIHPIKTANRFISALRERDARRAFCLALAGTLGVGNIFGVAAGIMIGGAGSVLWLFVSSVFAMVIKYSETLLVFDNLHAKGGMSAAIPDIFPRLGKLLSPTYALFTVALALFMGSAMQSTAVIDVADTALALKPEITALILVILFLPCVFGGAKKIESITEFLIPLTTIIYIIISFLVIFRNISELGTVINLIFSSAFSTDGILGGAVSSVSFLALKEGFARGILSNEAGVGTSALAHTRASGRTPNTAGLFGMCEVVFDTSILCMLTAFVILLAPIDISAYDTPMSLVAAAFTSVLGEWSGYLLLFLIFAFAYSTIICWYFYGYECSTQYFSKFKKIYIVAFPLFIIASSSISSGFLLYSIDLILFFMSLITLSAIIKKSERIRELTFPTDCTIHVKK